MKTKKRIQFVDMVKGIAVLTVIFYHITAPGTLADFFKGLMPTMLFAFFFFSGYFYSPGKKSIGASIAGKAKGLLVPFFKYSIVFWLIGSIYLIATGGAPLFETLCCLRNFYGGCIWNRVIQGWFEWEYYSLGSRYNFLADFWFLPAMFFAAIVFHVIADFSLSSKIKEVLSIVLLLAITGVLRYFDISLIYNIQLTPFFAAILLLGAVAKQHGFFEVPSLTGAKGYAVSILVMAVGIGVSVYFKYGSNMFRGTFDVPEVVSMLVIFVTGFMATWGMGYFFHLIEGTGIRVKELAYLGSHSIFLYIYHMFFAWIICNITGFTLKYDPETMEFTTTLVLKSLGIALGAIVLSLLCSIISDKIKSRKKDK